MGCRGKWFHAPPLPCMMNVDRQKRLDHLDVDDVQPVAHHVPDADADTDVLERPSSTPRVVAETPPLSTLAPLALQRIRNGPHRTHVGAGGDS